jgi:hypothetical protein
MLPFVLGAVIVTQVVPKALSWMWWGASATVHGAYWLVYGRHEQARMRHAVREEIGLQMHNYELVLGGTDVILVPRQK